jgi:predicted SAM-dependent methyltransferase
VDITEPADQIVDLEGAWPWPDSSVDEIVAHDIVEHLRDKRHTMNEAWRVLKPNGRFEIIVPTIRGIGAVCDPTHVSYWSVGDFEYYEKGNFARERFRDSYGIEADFYFMDEPIQYFNRNRFGEEVWKAKIVLGAIK